METNYRKHLVKFALIIMVIKTMLFILGTFLENNSPLMALLTIVYLATFCAVAIVMIRSFQRRTKLTLIEKIGTVAILFAVYEVCGILLYILYFTGIIGQEAPMNVILNKIVQIIKFDSPIFIVSAFVIGFVQSKTFEIEDKINQIGE
ncbi:MAG: hypothetical protein AAFP92_05150 [Bacteroidota bacterium]